MNRLAESTTTGGQPSLGGCDCDNCRGGDLPVNAFLAPRVTYGMLLGESDFRTMIGYPRGKQLLHHAWLHGTGVVWGYPVKATGSWELQVGSGLAIDPMGREVIRESWGAVDLRELRDQAQAAGRLDASGEDCDTVQVTGCLVARFDGCLSSPVPAYANPCDVTRRHDDYSRVLERARVEIRLGDCSDQCRGDYRRVRVLVGLAAGDPADERDAEALAARRRVLAAPIPAHELSCQVQAMACRDAAELVPEPDADGHLGLYPTDVEDAAVVLATVTITLCFRDDCWGFVGLPHVQECARTTLLPTDLISALACGLAPGLLGASGEQPVEGPRVVGPDISLDERGRQLTIPVTRRLLPGTVRGTVEVTTLAPDKDDRWVVEDVDDTTYAPDPDGPGSIAVRLAYSLNDRADHTLVRVRVRGTGGRPVMGDDPRAPLAGVVEGPPGNRHEGRDAVWTFEYRPASKEHELSEPASKEVPE